MVLYFLCWALLLYFTFIKTTTIKTGSENFSFLYLIFMSVTGFVSSMFFLMKYVGSKKEHKDDYLIFLTMATLPVLVSILFFMGNS